MANYNERLDEILEQRDTRLATLRRGYAQNRLGWTVDDGSAEQELYEKENKIKAEAKAKLQRLIVEAKLSELNALTPIDGLRRADSFDNSVFVVKVGGIHDRIAQLEKELENL